ncbi:MAG: hypothetical protein Q8R39_00020 [bacterium]|nr:hypothetical protein [bacterium]MDZ4284770.1 hypothetical protein [Patescibacteria group bacterium]
MNVFGFAEPLWLLLLVPLAAGFLARERFVHFIRKSTYERRGGHERGFARFALPRLFFGAVLLAQIVALADLLRGFTSLTEEVPRNQIIVGVDNSSSMYNFNRTEPLYCTDTFLKQEYPRIYIGCRALLRLIDEVEAFALRQKTRAADLIGILRFALYSKVQAYPTSDYSQLRKQILEMNWVLPGHLGVYTEVHLALWDMYLMALERNRARDTGLTFLSGEDMRKLAASLYPDSGTDRFSPPVALEGKLGRLRVELEDTVFILLTDAHPGQLEERLHRAPVSFKKLSELAALLELPIYMISTGEPNALYQRLVRETGFGPRGGLHRGNFFTLKSGRRDNLEPVDELVKTILSARFGRTVTVSVERRVSYATEAALVALTFLLCAVLWREYVDRSLTEV